MAHRLKNTPSIRWCTDLLQLNCLSETLFPEALDTARRLDEHMKQTGKPMGPFHGLPISLKDNFQIRGKPSAVGFVSWVNDPATKNSVLVDLLTASGAILYVKTAVPVAMMVAETITHIHGRTYNPLNRKLTSGGSSGGESALIAFGGSVLGVGTDIGESSYAKAQSIEADQVPFRRIRTNPSSLYWTLHSQTFVRPLSYRRLQERLGWPRSCE